MCDNCERKDRVIDSLKDAVKDNHYKQARLETINALYQDIRYPTLERKQKVIESLAGSNLELDFIRELTGEIKKVQGIHDHYN